MQCLIRVFQSEKSELQQQSSFRLTSRLFVYWGGGGELHQSRERVKFAVGSLLAPRSFSLGTPVFSFPQKPTFQIPVIKLEQFSVDCTLIDHRNDVRMFKAQAEQRATGELFEAKKRENKRRHHHVIFIVCTPIDQRF